MIEDEHSGRPHRFENGFRLQLGPLLGHGRAVGIGHLQQSPRLAQRDGIVDPLRQVADDLIVLDFQKCGRVELGHDDADDFAALVHQRSAAVAGVHVGVNLEHLDLVVALGVELAIGGGGAGRADDE